MSVWCNKCNKKTFNERMCDHCGAVLKKEKKYNLKTNHKARIINSAGLDNDNITISKNKLIVIALIVIAISVSYLAYNKYEENRQMSKISKMLLGTDDPDKIMDMIDRQNKQSAKMIKEINQQSIRMIEEQRKRSEELFKR